MVMPTHVWDLKLVHPTNEMYARPAVKTDPAIHRVLMAREHDPRPLRTFEWLDDFATQTELTRFRDLWRMTGGALPIAVSIPGRNMLRFSQDLLTGIASRSGDWAWSINAGQAEVTASGEAAPVGSGTVYRLGVKAAGSSAAVISQHLSDAMAKAYTLSAYFKEDDSAQDALGFKDSSGAYRLALFDWTAGVLAVGTVDGMLSGAAVTSVGSGWYRAQVTMDLSKGASGNSAISMPLWARVSTGRDAPVAGKGSFVYGVQLALGTVPLAYREVGAIREGFLPCTMAGDSVTWARLTDNRYSMSVRLEETYG